MKKFTATTKSGTTYTSDGRIVTVHPRNGYPYAIKPVYFKNVDRAIEAFPYVDVPQAEAPVVGLHIFIVGISDWRLSTEVAKVELSDELVEVTA